MRGVRAGLRWLVDVPRPGKIAIIAASDVLLCLAAVWLAFSLRLGVWMGWSDPMRWVAAVAVASWLTIAFARGIYRTIVRSVGGRAMTGLFVSVALLVVPLVAFFFFRQVIGVPRTVALLHPFLFAILLALSRIVARYLLIDVLNQGLGGETRRTLVYGAGDAGQQLARAMRGDPKMRLVGFLDDQAGLSRQLIDGVAIYRGDDVAQVVRALDIDMVLLAMPSLSRGRRRQLVDDLGALGVQVRTLPDLGQLIDGRIDLGDLREVQVEDLLGRDPVPPEPALMGRNVTGRVVMVTGAGGSIGSELVRQILAHAPSRLILVEQSEYGLYVIEDELRQRLALVADDRRPDIVAELGSIADRDAVRRLMGRWRPDTVFHAAAYKHVPLVEANPVAGIRNNVFSTWFLAEEARAVGVRNFTLISTDKAVRPTNVMGASKRVCELVLQALAAEEGPTTFAMVRFGNVLGSSGSVVPRFKEQIAAGGPITLTHRDVTRYFMTIPEAAQLVVQASAMATGGEVFVLDMGQSVRIHDLACEMVRLAGLTVRDADRPDGDIAIVEVGLRPGEKMYEELLIGDNPEPTTHDRIMKAQEERLGWAELRGHLERLSDALAVGDADRSVAVVAGLVPALAAAQRSGGDDAAGLAAARPVAEQAGGSAHPVAAA